MIISFDISWSNSNENKILDRKIDLNIIIFFSNKYLILIIIIKWNYYIYQVKLLYISGEIIINIYIKWNYHYKYIYQMKLSL